MRRNSFTNYKKLRINNRTFLTKLSLILNLDIAVLELSTT